MQITPDFSDTTDFEIVAIGTYTAQVVDSEARTSQAGNPYVSWRLSIVDDEKFTGRQVFLTTPTTGRGAFRLKNFLQATGVPAGTFDTEQVLGKQVRITVDHRKSDDGAKTFTDVTTVTAV